MARSRDLGRSRELIAKRKQARAAAQWNPDQNKQDWKKFIRCGMCGMKLCVNNYPDRKPRLGNLTKVGNRVLCFRCKDFAPILKYLMEKAEGGSKKAQVSQSNTAFCNHGVLERIV